MSVPLFAANTALVARFQSGDPVAAEQLVQRNGGLVNRIAARYRLFAGSLEFDDLLVEGQIGLLHAAELFDCARGYQFSTYATAWVGRFIARAIEVGGNLIAVPAPVERRRRKNGEGPVVSFVSLDDPLIPEGDRLCDFIPAPGAGPEGLVVNRRLVETLLAALTPREREVISRRFGLGGRPQETLREIGEDLHLSHQGVRNIQARALNRMRGLVGAGGSSFTTPSPLGSASPPGSPASPAPNSKGRRSRPLLHGARKD